MSFPSAILQHGALTWRAEGTLFPLTVPLAIAILPLSKGTILRQSRIQVAIHKIFDCRPLFPLAVYTLVSNVRTLKGSNFRQFTAERVPHRSCNCRTLFPSATVGVISKNTQLKGFNFLLAMERELPRGATARRIKFPAARRKMRYPHVAKLPDPFPSGRSTRRIPTPR